MALKEFKESFSFEHPDRIFISGVEADLSSHIGKMTALQQAPFLANFNMRLVFPRILIRGEKNNIGVATCCFGNGWEKKAAPPLGVKSYTFKAMNKKAWKGITALQTKSYVRKQLLEQATLFKDKSDLFSQYGICPPAGDILEIKNVTVNDFWPHTAIVGMRVDGNFYFEYNLQISKEYLDKFGVIYAVEVENAHKLLKPGTWEIRKGEAYNPYIKKKYLGNGKQLEIGPKSTKTNFINGYYIDWDIFAASKDILNV